ncbi:uncharacterized protein LOC111244130 isoform X2 [Varroa destructor]|uniref:Uncharacterized protein n=1 Tax=Varroa destructor TaxID=109461 RepID=A0A7M7M9V2_VARDE|nr:uncharacterized protein LOC111244130 isoform X2 [Varroa destructor]
MVQAQNHKLPPTPMADEAARRRELRRQRILANSESRLQLILSNGDRVSHDKPFLAPDQPEQPPIAIVANVTSTDADNLLNPQLNAISRKSSNTIETSEVSPGHNGRIYQLPGKTIEQTLIIGSPPANDRVDRVQSNYSPITNMDFTDIPSDERQLFGGDIYGTADILAAEQVQTGANFRLPPDGEFENTPLAQLLSNLTDNDEAPLVTLANLAGRLGLPEADQNMNRAIGGRGTATDRQSAGEIARRRYQVLWDPCHLRRTLFISVLAVLARFVLPVLPADYAIMFAPLYLLELLSISLCIFYSVPLNRSRMSIAFSILLFMGASRKSVQFGQTLTACFEIFLRDLSIYTFSFFMAHAFCQHADLLAVTT